MEHLDRGTRNEILASSLDIVLNVMRNSHEGMAEVIRNGFFTKA
jgi:hypothetical protein